MGKVDTVTKEYIKNPIIYADAFNKFLYHGRQVIKPENLRELDTVEIAVPYGNDGVGVPEQRYRDALKLWMTDGKMAYCILGIEGQEKIHYAAPVKNMVYDAMQLAHQVTEAAQAHKDSDGDYKPSSAEYLSGFYKSDRLLPVITLVIFFGSDAWDGPLSLREMYCVADEAVMKYVPDYKVNLIAPEQMTDEELDEFTSSLKEVMTYIKYAKDKKKLEEAVYKNEKFKCLERQAAEVIKVTTNSTRLKYPEGEELIDVCLALEEMCKENLDKGVKQGVKQGVDILIEIIQKLRSGESVEELKKNYDEDIIQKALLVK